jgi:hypothetical protein
VYCLLFLLTKPTPLALLPVAFTSLAQALTFLVRPTLGDAPQRAHAPHTPCAALQPLARSRMRACARAPLSLRTDAAHRCACVLIIR